jgi:hypothetical protein
MTDPQTASTGVNVHLKIFPLGFLLLLFRPRLSVDGGPPAKMSWGKAFVPLAPGTHTLRCYLPYLWYRHLGDATTEVPVGPGAAATVQWRTPWLVFLAGKWKTVTTP